jgi:D-serine deaminase-like pyridoxal phosphate-dependent protein
VTGTSEELRARLDAATAHLDPPFAVLDGAALRANAADLVRRAAGKPVRVASKSVRVRSVLDDVLSGASAGPGFAGVMAYSLREALWLVGHGYRDVLMGYPTVDRGAIAALGADPVAAASITLMVDGVGQLDVVDAVLGHTREQVRVCLDVDASLRLAGAHLGVRRSPLHTVDEVAELARIIQARNGFRLRGLMFYEAQIAGLPDSSPAVRLVKRRSATELRARRGAVVAAVRHVAGDLELVNSGGTGSLHVTTLDPTVTELTAGSGLFAPTLFDGYRSFTPRPAAYFALPVVRRPARGLVTVFGGGYIASGAAGRSRWPTPVLPTGLTLLGTEGAGEVQTPVSGRAADRLAVGDRIWFRHTKAGEVAERFDVLHLVEGPAVTAAVATYRGEGQNFG